MTRVKASIIMRILVEMAAIKQMTFVLAGNMMAMSHDDDDHHYFLNAQF